jgi:hypothetical protein
LPMPVPPVVTTSLADPAACRNESSMAGCSSGTVTRSTVSKPDASNSRATAGPDRSFLKPREEASLTVITAAVRRSD